MNDNNATPITSCFQHLPETDLEFISKQKTEVPYYKGETIFKQGAFAPHVMFVNEGVVLVFFTDPKRANRLI